ncbi:ATP-binding protein [Phaeobacter gallaeciensis]|uniref:ATP-binding protein n=1 Tax=Phaeobacter gallaeciensis TaxID=60890 RepID=UPI00237F8249|nr:ATP-binding protein [Phaeobacter gallaeciensis]MDE4193006.1 ATP-binding protein [Phaeobacter gallaeciensis]MDE4201283.1 ATP-binding protein [Phaeobacter gallaeciensis]MDE4205503.1 ATP-binding protein [Phaeobacter gallaeciensis]MDE4209606.1 ATP-binding protein [Phaeobacter gallaeciensis]MDE4218010.1 ATP-binding protein [Phaeobacter gallaeciensis]
MSFRLKTVLGIALIELTVMAVLIGINQFALGGSAATQLYQRAEATARVFANTVADAVIATDLATLDATIDMAVSSEDLTYLRVRNPSGMVLSQGGVEAALAAPFVRDASFDDARKDHVIDIDLPIEVEGTEFGTIELGLSTRTVEQELAQALYSNILIAVIGMSLVAVFGFCLGTILTQQLRWLRQGALNIARGNLASQIKVKGRDELADTAKCFNYMAQTLARDRGILQDQQDELLAKRARVEVLVGCLRDISQRRHTMEVPDTERPDEIGDMARATVVFQNAMKAVELARQEQQRLISAFDQVEEQVAIFGEDGRVLFLNAAFRSFNTELLELLPDKFTLRSFLETGLKQAAFIGIEDPETWVEEQLRRSHGLPHEIRREPDRILLTVQSYVDGIGTVLSAKDITDLRHSEHQLIHASKLATLGEMATGVAHELNQPLGVIRMASTNCVKRIDKDKADLEYLRSKLIRIGEQTERASQIINHMRIFGRKAEGVNSPFDLRDSLQEISALARTQLHTLDISLTLDLPETPAIVLGEKVIFEQVLLNLISNARDAIEASEARKGKISITSVFAADEGHVIEVRDTGGGIPEGILDKLFDPFFTTKGPGKGTGLGLSISFGTIRDMSGTISASSEEDGACFRLVLPDAGPGLQTLGQPAA